MYHRPSIFRSVKGCLYVLSIYTTSRKCVCVDGQFIITNDSESIEMVILTHITIQFLCFRTQFRPVRGGTGLSSVTAALG